MTAKHRYCFVQSMLDRGQLLPGVATVLQEWHDFAEETFDMRPHAIGESTSYIHPLVKTAISVIFLS